MRFLKCVLFVIVIHASTIAEPLGFIEAVELFIKKTSEVGGEVATTGAAVAENIRAQVLIEDRKEQRWERGGFLCIFAVAGMDVKAGWHFSGTNRLMKGFEKALKEHLRLAPAQLNGDETQIVGMLLRELAPFTRELRELETLSVQVAGTPTGSGVAASWGIKQIVKTLRTGGIEELLRRLHEEQSPQERMFLLANALMDIEESETIDNEMLRSYLVLKSLQFRWLTESWMTTVFGLSEALHEFFYVLRVYNGVSAQE